MFRKSLGYANKNQALPRLVTSYKNRSRPDRVPNRKIITSSGDGHNQLTKYHEFKYESDFIQNSPHKPIVIPNVRLDQYVFKDYKKWQNKPAITCAITKRRYTYSQLRDRTATLAVNLLSKFRLRPGDKVAICLPNIPEFPIAALGAIEAGFVITTINPIYTAHEMCHQLSNSGAKLVVTTADNYTKVQEALTLGKLSAKIIVTPYLEPTSLPDGAINFLELINSKNIDFTILDSVAVDPNGVCALPYSSGTTGVAKGVRLSHNNLTTNSEMLNCEMHGIYLVRPADNFKQDILCSVLPFFHIYGFNSVLMSKLVLGVEEVTLPSFKPDTFFNFLIEFKPTVLFLVPPIIIFMGHFDQITRKHMESTRRIISGAAPIGQSDVERFQNKASDALFMQGYGLTETSPVVLFEIRGKNYKSVGHCTASTQAKVALVGDETYTAQGPNVSGEILVRGPQIMLGYQNNDKANAETLVGDGWLRTGDIGHYDDIDGSFYITERAKELIKVKGFQVPPAELEAILRTHPDVLEAAVIGVPHPLHGEVPRAYIVARAGAKVSDNEIKEYVANQVASFKKLEGGVEFINVIPKNTTGKILRRKLKEKYDAEHN